MSGNTNVVKVRSRSSNLFIIAITFAGSLVPCVATVPIHEANKTNPYNLFPSQLTRVPWNLTYTAEYSGAMQQTFSGCNWIGPVKSGGQRSFLTSTPTGAPTQYFCGTTEPKQSLYPQSMLANGDTCTIRFTERITCTGWLLQQNSLPSIWTNDCDLVRLNSTVTGTLSLSVQAREPPFEHWPDTYNTTSSSAGISIAAKFVYSKPCNLPFPSNLTNCKGYC